jgi:hypothetical protein
MHNTPKPVTRAVCASVSRIEGYVIEEHLSIRNDICTPGSLPVRYAFLYTSGWFILWVEGSDEGVTAAIERAAKDRRNHHQKLLHRSTGPASLRERVVVATTQTPMKPSQFARWVMQMKDDGPMLEPLEIWNRLGAPCLVGALHAPCSRPSQQFALVVADDHGPVDQLRKIGERFHTPVIYQRFGLARRHSPDMGMAYVDVPTAQGAARIRVLTRRALAQDEVKQSMPRIDAMVLLVGTRPAPAIELTTSVAEAVRGISHAPQVWVVGPAGEPTESCTRLLERAGVPAHRGPPAADGHVDLPALLPALGVEPRGNSVSPEGKRMDTRPAQPFLRSIASLHRSKFA